MKKRNPYFDNTRAILIVFVIFGHLISNMLYENDILNSLYMFIYLFHMPAFILVSGHFAKKITSFGGLRNIIKKLLVPYLILQVVYTYYYDFFYKDNIELTFLQPRWALWFLLSLFCWNLLLSVTPKGKKGVLLSILVSLAAGYISDINEVLSLSRTFFFYPFYVIGFNLGNGFFEVIKLKSNVIISWLLIAFVLVLVYLFGDIGWREWLYGRLPYEDITDGNFAYSGIYRFFIYLIMILTTYCVLSVMPDKELPITKIGSLTLIVYLFHMFFIKYLQESEFYGWIGDSDQYYLLFVIPFIVVYLLTRKPVVNIGSKLIGAKIKVQ